MHKYIEKRLSSFGITKKTSPKFFGPEGLSWEPHPKGVKTTSPPAVYSPQNEVHPASTPEEVDEVLRYVIQVFHGNIVVESLLQTFHLCFFLIRLEVPREATWRTPDRSFGFEVKGDIGFIISAGTRRITVKKPDIEGTLHYCRTLFSVFLKKEYDETLYSADFLYSFKDGLLHKEPCVDTRDLLLVNP